MHCANIHGMCGVFKKRCDAMHAATPASLRPGYGNRVRFSGGAGRSAAVAAHVCDLTSTTGSAGAHLRPLASVAYARTPPGLAITHRTSSLVKASKQQ